MPPASYPQFSEAMVVAPDPTVHGLRVVLASGQVPAFPIKVLHHGAADAVAVNHAPLPRPGTKGLVVFPAGDPRNGVWLGSMYLAGQDAYSTDTDPNLKFDAHWSGHYEMLDGEGRWTQWHPDGTFIQVSDTTSLPSIYRHTVDQAQARQLELFPNSERVPNPPSARHFLISHSSSTNVHIDPSGNTTVTGASGATLKFIFGGTTATIDSSGNVTFAMPNGDSFNVTTGGGSATHPLALADVLATWLASHTHSNGNGGANTGAPNQTITTSTIKTAIVNTSS